jgi:hypothetical protein
VENAFIVILIITGAIALAMFIGFPAWQVFGIWSGFYLGVKYG